MPKSDAAAKKSATSRNGRASSHGKANNGKTNGKKSTNGKQIANGQETPQESGIDLGHAGLAYHHSALTDNVIRIRGARQHNLKNLDLEIPRNKLIVFTGVSGSGKSSLAFDTILT
jgi:excinuclease ABC subunit A